MDDITKSQLKSKLQDYATRELESSPNGGPHHFVCPHCKSGTGPNKSGALSLKGPDFETWKCFSCDQGGDIFDLYGAVNGISDTGERFRGVAAFFGQNTDAPAASQTPQKGQTGFDAGKYIADCAKRANQTEYLTKRGFTPETVKRFNLGYDPACWIAQGTQGPAVIIPCSDDYYIRRPLDPAAAGGQKYKAMSGKAIEFWGAEKLTEATDEPVFIVEGAFDAISLEQAGASAISINSQSNKKKLIQCMEANRPQRPLIVAFDPDEQAQKSQAEIIEAARSLGVLATGFDFSTETDKDPNDLLQQGLSSLQAAIKTARLELDIKAKEATADAAELLVREQEAYLGLHKLENIANRFLDFIESGDDNIQIPTGFKHLDEVLGGGLTGGSLLCLGAISSLGKTTFALQMADQIAAQGHDVLFFTLEMPQFELVSRSVSRYAFDLAGEAEALCLSARSILRYKTWADAPGAPDKLLHILQSTDEYTNDVGQHLYFNEGLKDDFGPFTALDIEHAVNEHIRLTGNKPVVFIDYLQILGQLNNRGTDKQNTDMNVTILKRMARQLDIALVVISALNRENYRAEISMAAFKESGLIEYSSDVLLGLQARLREDEKRDKLDIDEFKTQPTWPLELKVLKNRNGASGSRLPFNCTAIYNHFAEDVFSKADSLNYNRAGRQRNYI